MSKGHWHKKIFRVKTEMHRLKERHEDRDCRDVELPGQHTRKHIGTLDLRLGGRCMSLIDYNTDTDGFFAGFTQQAESDRKLGLPVFGRNYLAIIADISVANDKMKFLSIVFQVGVGSFGAFIDDNAFGLNAVPESGKTRPIRRNFRSYGVEIVISR